MLRCENCEARIEVATMEIVRLMLRCVNKRRRNNKRAQHTTYTIINRGVKRLSAEIEERGRVSHSNIQVKDCKRTSQFTQA